MQTTGQSRRQPRPRGRGLTLLESGQVFLTWQLARTLLGMTTYFATLGGGLAIGSYAGALSGEGNEEGTRPVYIAPPDPERSIAAQERVTYVALETGVPAEQLPEGEGGTTPRPPAGSTAEAAGPPLAPEESAPTASEMEEIALTEIQVDSAVTPDPESGGPSYPPLLLKARVEGEVLARFIVDTTGRADPVSFIAIQTSDSAFTNAVREALPLMKFRPARLRGVPVPQVVIQSFAFRISNLPRDTARGGIPLPGRGPQPLQPRR